MFTSSQRLQNSNYSKLTLHQPGNFLKKKHQKTHLKLGTAEFAILIRIDLFKELPLTDGPSTVYIYIYIIPIHEFFLEFHMVNWCNLNDHFFVMVVSIG